jgi:hypothetical protein
MAQKSYGRIPDPPPENKAWAAASATNHEFNVEEGMQSARAEMARVSSPAYLAELRGTMGADPFHGQIPS